MTARYSIGKAAAFADRLGDRAAWYSGGAWERGRIAVRRTLAQSGLPVTREFLSLGCARGNEASGFFSEFCAVVGALAHYEAHTAIYAGLQVDFADEGLYYEAAAGPNWWEFYFEPAHTQANVACPVKVFNYNIPVTYAGIGSSTWNIVKQ